jgi:hypothetical protein
MELFGDTGGMAIAVVPVILLPTMDIERFERCSFALDIRESLLTVFMTDLPPFLIHFHRLRWHRCTPHVECGPGLIQGCDMAVAEVRESPALKHYVKKEMVPEQDAATLHHFRVYLGKGGCHEAFARSAYASGQGSLSRAVAGIANRLKTAVGR